MKSRLAQGIKVAVAIFLIVILISEALVFVPPFRQTVSFSVGITQKGSLVTVTTTVQSTLTLNLRQTIYLVPTAASRETAYFYFDGAYPYSFSDPVSWFGLSQHLSARAALRGQSFSEVMLSAPELAQLLQQPPDNRSILVMASGVLPSTVFTAQSNLVARWVSAGGVMVWLGDRLGSYSGTPGVPLTDPASQVGNAGAAQFYNLSQLGGRALNYLNSSATSMDFGLNYSLGEPGNDWNLTELRNYGNLALGPTADGFTDISLLHLGSGAIVDFGAPPTDSNTAAGAILNLMLAGLSSGNFTILSSTAWTAYAGTTTPGPESVTLPSGPLPAGTSVCALTLQTDYLGPYANSTCEPLA